MISWPAPSVAGDQPKRQRPNKRAESSIREVTWVVFLHMLGPDEHWRWQLLSARMTGQNRLPHSFSSVFSSFPAQPHADMSADNEHKSSEQALRKRREAGHWESSLSDIPIIVSWFLLLSDNSHTIKDTNAPILFIDWPSRQCKTHFNSYFMYLFVKSFW